MSNVKIGDLAIVVSPPLPGLEGAVGTFVTVVGPYNTMGGYYKQPREVCWEVRLMNDSMGGTFTGPIKAGELVNCPDAVLRPIRPPGKLDELPAPPVTKPVLETV